MTRFPRPLSGMLILVAALLLPAAGLAAEPEQAAERAVMVGDEVDLTGEVVSIDAKTRSVVVRGEAGREVTLRAPDAAANFDKISVGDRVDARYYESLVVAVAPVADAEPGASELAAVSLAPPGGTPGGVIAEQLEVRAVVRAVDPEALTVTLEGPTGGERTLKTSGGVDLTKLKVGEEVRFTLTRALAITLTPQ